MYYKLIAGEVNKLPAAVNPRPRSEGAVKRRWLLRLKDFPVVEGVGKDDDEGFMEPDGDKLTQEEVCQIKLWRSWERCWC